MGDGFFFFKKNPNTTSILGCQRLLHTQLNSTIVGAFWSTVRQKTSEKFKGDGQVKLKQKNRERLSSQTQVVRDLVTLKHIVYVTWSRGGNL